MTTVGITGAAGFLGWHIRCRLHALGVPVLTATRETFAEPKMLADFCRSADIVVHTAGVNRASSDEEVAHGNRVLAEQLTAALAEADSTAPLLYTNSTQSDHDNPYGASKREAAEILSTHCDRAGAPFLDLVLPHLFGEFGRPNYNSVVSTFAHALANDAQVSVNGSGELELLHAQRVAELVAAFVDSPTPGRHRARGTAITVGEVWDRLRALHHRYVGEKTIPDVSERLDLDLFNTLRSQLYEAGYYPQPLVLHADHRGAFAELCRADGTGQTSISTSVPGILRGDHFHFDKIERFVVVQGSAEISLRRLFTNETNTFTVCGDQPALIDMPPLVTHNIVNTCSEPVVTVFWAGDHFDPQNPDTFVEPVEGGPAS